jgi:acyl carrier protein
MEQRIKALIAGRFLGGNDQFSSSAWLGDLGITSLQFVEMLFRLEEEFGIEIPDDEIVHGRFANVERIAEYVECKVKGVVPPLPPCAAAVQHMRY